MSCDFPHECSLFLTCMLELLVLPKVPQCSSSFSLICNLLAPCQIISGLVRALFANFHIFHSETENWDYKGTIKIETVVSNVSKRHSSVTAYLKMCSLFLGSAKKGKMSNNVFPLIQSPIPVCHSFQNDFALIFSSMYLHSRPNV